MPEYKKLAKGIFLKQWQLKAPNERRRELEVRFNLNGSDESFREFLAGLTKQNMSIGAMARHCEVSPVTMKKWCIRHKVPRLKWRSEL